MMVETHGNVRRKMQIFVNYYFCFYLSTSVTSLSSWMTVITKWHQLGLVTTTWSQKTKVLYLTHLKWKV